MYTPTSGTTRSGPLRQRRATTAPWRRAHGVAVALALALAAAACQPAVSAYTPRDPALRRLPLYFYPAADSTHTPRAFVFFFGNDVGFWEAHQELATRLAGNDYSVVGFDVKQFFGTLPDAPAARDSAFAASITPIIQRSRHELGADSLPVIIGGHSIGAEIALWTAAHAAPPGTVGVLALSPGMRSHLRVSMSDILNRGEPHEAGSFDVPAQIAASAPLLRVAIIRGGSDKYGYADSALIAAAPDRVRRFGVPFAGHSMKRLTLAGPVILRAMGYLLAPAATGAQSGR
ncbi:MAG TPA: hypothetical protein VNS52_07325 [Gemmatimonadaceae bacterium]|nr:hypothetical protein [Gemmatimonadaceae bacterium]